MAAPPRVGFLYPQPEGCSKPLRPATQYPLTLPPLRVLRPAPRLCLVRTCLDKGTPRETY